MTETRKIVDFEIVTEDWWDKFIQKNFVNHSAIKYLNLFSKFYITRILDIIKFCLFLTERTQTTIFAIDASLSWNLRQLTRRVWWTTWACKSGEISGQEGIRDLGWFGCHAKDTVELQSKDRERDRAILPLVGQRKELLGIYNILMLKGSTESVFCLRAF
jgi:hypothetical protein